MLLYFSITIKASTEVNEIYAHLDADSPKEISEAVEEIQKSGDNKAEPSEAEKMLTFENEKGGIEESEASHGEGQRTIEVDREVTNDKNITDNDDDEIENQNG